MSNVKHAVIAAAGLGSRLGLGKPKCLLEVDNKPLIEYQLKLLKNVADVRVVVGFEEHLVIPLVKKIKTRCDHCAKPSIQDDIYANKLLFGSIWCN